MTEAQNHSPKRLLDTLRPIKKAIPDFFKEDVNAELNALHPVDTTSDALHAKDRELEGAAAEKARPRFMMPPHKTVPRVSDEYREYDPDSDGETVDLAYEMRTNPYVSIHFTDLHRLAPETVNEEGLEEFISYLHENSYVPDDVTVVLSPYNAVNDALNLVVIFSAASYLAPEEESATFPDAEPSADADAAPAVVNPRDPRAWLS